MKNKIVNLLIIAFYLALYKIFGFEPVVIILLSDWFYSWYVKNK
jgi:hypothetical protein